MPEQAKDGDLRNELRDRVETDTANWSGRNANRLSPDRPLFGAEAMSAETHIRDLNSN